MRFTPRKRKANLPWQYNKPGLDANKCMVKIREDQNFKIEETGGVLDLNQWLNHVKKKSVALSNEDDFSLLRQAAELSQSVESKAIKEGNASKQGFSSFLVGLQMVDIMLDLNMDADALIAALLYRSVREDKLSLKKVEDQLGNIPAKLIRGVLDMAAISAYVNADREPFVGEQQHHLDNVRKMLIAMVDDVRVAIIKLAERTCAIRSVNLAPKEKRRKVAREIFDIYAPLAHRLGIGHIKWELEDLSFRYLKPDDYKKISNLLAERRLNREQYIEQVVETLDDSLREVDVKADLAGRVKHIYSIWRKMQRKNIDFHQVYDIRAIRILVPTIADCYAALGIVHSLWTHIPKEFDDYITSPKENGYRSLHTAVIGPKGKVLEIQIRTYEMHDEAELGVCAHWKYKEGEQSKTEKSYESKISWLRQVLEWQEELEGNVPEQISAALKNNIVDERVYVFTPKGDVLDLPLGGTPVDFAYRVHTEVGHHCRGAQVDGRIVPLNHKLKTGDRVEIITANSGGPSKDWLNPGSGYLVAPRSRSKVQHWFKEQDRDQNIVDGKSILNSELQRLAIRTNLDVVAQKLNLKKEEDLFAAVGAGDIKLGQVLSKINTSLQPEKAFKFQPSQSKVSLNKSDDGIYIHGVGNLLTTIAGCCKPVPGENVIGYVTVGRGVTVHRQDCKHLLSLVEKDPDRIVDVSWGETRDKIYPVDIMIHAYDREGLLKDIINILSNENINVTSMNTHSTIKRNTADMKVTLEVASIVELGGVLSKINQLQNVIKTRRVSQT